MPSTYSFTSPRDLLRGHSAIRAKGNPLRFKLITASNLPKPVLDREELTTPTTNHGLMGFFNKKGTLLSDPTDDSEHGRGWTVEELSLKTWEEMHYLWWECMKERNRLATEQVERVRLKPGYGQYEADERLRAVQATMRAIRETLLERSYAQTDAVELAKVDPEIQYNPRKNTYLFLGEIEEEGDVNPLAYDTMYEEEDLAEAQNKDAEGRLSPSSTDSPKAGDFPTMDPSTTEKPSSAREDKRL
ncbi:hypothetical protein BLS_005261 [Venturia inaequalis]|uniref:Large ribosomal subunit protein uL29m n=1 Tax=Venturia inaequalis TaxID=5025 RepID=A0A8H3V7L5_VENIN|nr:hypothetical protein BLS_005261 [Venturia inaequalis]